MKKYFLLVASVLLLAACSSDSETATATVDNTIVDGDLDGTWLTGCVVEDGTDSLDATAVFTSAPNSIDVTIVFWFGVTDCSGTSAFTEDVTGTFSITGTNSTLSNRIVSQVDETDTVDNITPTDTTAATTLNSASAWGITSWTGGGTQSVLNVEFDGTAFTYPTKDVFGVDTAVTPNLLYVGDDDTVDADGYPAALDTAVILEKQ